MISKSFNMAVFMDNQDSPKRHIDILDNIYEKAERDTIKDLYGTLDHSRGAPLTSKSVKRK